MGKTERMKRFEAMMSGTSIPQVPVQKKETVKVQNRQTRGATISKADMNDLVIALNYAINTIKNKVDVREKKESSTYFTYFQRWNKIQKKLKEKIK